ncbi:MAG TPA: bifunctional UDP-sugar hydrolase/5'-nucleotidase [Gemmatimonadales bacterium]
MSLLRRLAPGLALGALAGCLGLPPAPAPTNPMRFLSINDVYVADTLADGSGGLARVATMRARVQAEGPTLFVLAGDFLSPSLLSKYYQGRQMVEALNAAKLDYATFGNHEFELPRDTLVDRIHISNFKWLSANCREANGDGFPGVLAWDTVRLAHRKVGIFGLTLQGDYSAYVKCTDPDSAARFVIDTLIQQGADFVVALTHQTVEADRALLNREGRLDMVLGGHEHEHMTVLISNRYILKADANSRTAQFATVWGSKGQWREAVALLAVSPAISLDTTVARIVAGWADSLRGRLGPQRVLGTLLAPLDARDIEQRRDESPLGDLVTDAIRAGTNSDAALLNSGAIRIDDILYPGPFTNYALESLFLFGDETRIVVVTLTGARVRELLERSLSDGVIGKGGFLQISGLSFAYDPSRPSMSRIVGDMIRPDGEVIGASTPLRVALPTYLACKRGDGYDVPEAGAACQSGVGSAPRTVDLVSAYVADSLHGSIVPPPGGRITRR